MSAEPIRLLLLEDNPGDARLVQEALAEHAPGEFAITWVERLADALARIAADRFDAVLCDLGLPDSTGLATTQAIAGRFPALPLVVLTGSHDQSLGREAIQHGAQDYLVKGESDGVLIARTLHFAIERKSLEIGLRAANEALERRVAERTAELQAAVSGLQESLSRARALSETTLDAIITADQEGTIIGWNQAAERMFGYTPAEALGQPLTLVIPQRYRGEHLAGVQRVRTGGARHLVGGRVELHGLTKAGLELPLELSLSTWETSNGRVFACIARDISERKRAELALERQKDLYAVLSLTNQAIVRASSPEALFAEVCRIAVEHGRFQFGWIGLLESDGRSLKLLARYGEDAGFLREVYLPLDEEAGGRGIIGQVLHTGRRGYTNDILAEARSAPWHAAARRAGVRSLASLPISRGGALIGAINLYAGEAEFFTEELLATLDEMAADISFALDSFEREAERARAVDALRESGLRYRLLFDANPHPMWVYEPETLRFLAVNHAAVALYGYSEAEFLAMTIADIRPPEDVPRIRETVTAQASASFREGGVWRHRKKDGTLIDVEIAAHGLDFGGRRARVVLAHDVTERLRVARELTDSEERFRGLVEQSIAGIYIIQDRRFAYVNPRFAEIRGYGSADEIIGRDSTALVAEKDRALVAGNARRLLAGETRSVSANVTALRKDGSTVEIGMQGIRASYRGRPAIIGMIQDISEKTRAEEQIRRYVMQLEKAFMSTVGVATTLSEMRDPYTAGHERRVAEIAVAIGAELGFDARRQEGLRVAGYLHDIGKITIPSEILSKPGRLSPLEFELIQGHPQASYDVLKDVEFPWPVADVARQHHERIDGSGYPQGLKGEAILFEARIMAVADVVEAMSSHRPYRAGLGIDTALAEIERGRGTAYDPVAADACLKLFRETGYEIPG